MVHPKNRANSWQPLICVLLLILVAPGCRPKVNVHGKKILRLAMPANNKGFDPALSEDAYTNQVIHEIYEPLYQYAYRQRPIVLEPCLAKSMPQVSADGRTYDIEIKSGVYFTDDPAFTPTGKGRELVASDIVYSLKRLADAKVNSTGWWLLNQRIVGLDEFRQLSTQQQPTDYQRDVVGLQVVNKYRLRIVLTAPYPQLLYALAMPYTSAVAKEVIDYYGREIINHPVGTGPFILARYRRDYEMVLHKNPTYRYETTQIDGQEKQIPQLDEVVIRIYREPQPRWLNFLQGNFDWNDIPKDNFDSIIDAQGNLQAEYVKKGIELWKGTSLDLTYTGFNMNDRLLGKNVHLRRAMSLAFDTQKRIERLYNGRAISAQGPIPPGLAGYDAKMTNRYKQYDLNAARRELSLAGYPNGKGLPSLTLESIAETSQRHFDELFVTEMAALGIKIKVSTNTWPEFLAKINKGEAAIFGMAWGADYPDAENFLSLFFSRNRSPGSNNTNYNNPIYDQLYRQASQMLDSPERTALYQKMVAMINADVPMIYGVHRLRFVPHYRWLKNFLPHPMLHGFYKYFDIDNAEKAKLLGAS